MNNLIQAQTHEFLSRIMTLYSGHSDSINQLNVRFVPTDKKRVIVKNLIKRRNAITTYEKVCSGVLPIADEYFKSQVKSKINILIERKAILMNYGKTELVKETDSLIHLLYLSMNIASFFPNAKYFISHKYNTRMIKIIKK